MKRFTRSGFSVSRFLVGDDAGADLVDARVGEADRRHRLAGGVLQLDGLVHHVAQQQVGLAVDHGIELGLRVARDDLELVLP